MRFLNATGAGTGRKAVPLPFLSLGRGRLFVLAALTLTMLWVSGGGNALAQGADDDPIVLVNQDGRVVERKKDGKFIARPIFDRKIAVLAYGIRDADTGDWTGGVTHVNAKGKRLSEGWEYTLLSIPATASSPISPTTTTYVLFLLASETSPGTSYEFYVVVPIYESGKLWDRVVAALNPTRWAKAVATWIVSTGVLGLIIGWMGLSFILQEHLGRQSIGWKEMVPRLCLGLAAAAASLWWCSLVIDLADSISGYVAAELNVQPGDLVRGPLNIFVQSIEAGTAGMGLFLAAVYLVYGLFVLIIVVQLIIRLALIDVLLALAPVGLGLWILPHTAGWGRHWLRLFMVTVMQQSVQLLAIAFGFGFLQEFAAIADGVRARGGPDLEAAHERRIHVSGNEGPLDARQRRDLRCLGTDIVLLDGRRRRHRQVRQGSDDARIRWRGRRYRTRRCGCRRGRSRPWRRHRRCTLRGGHLLPTGRRGRSGRLPQERRRVGVSDTGERERRRGCRARPAPPDQRRR